MLNRVESTVCSRATTVVYTQEVPYSTVYGWNKQTIQAQCSILTYNTVYGWNRQISWANARDLSIHTVHDEVYTIQHILYLITLVEMI